MGSEMCIRDSTSSIGSDVEFVTEYNPRDHAPLLDLSSDTEDPNPVRRSKRIKGLPVKRLPRQDRVDNESLMDLTPKVELITDPEEVPSPAKKRFRKLAREF